jgi:preprotein translocase subunit SecD
MLEFPQWKKITVWLICLWFMLLALPNFLDDAQRSEWPEFLPQKTLNLGLDLQGGSHLQLEVDFNHYLKEQLDNLAEEVRASLREQRMRYRDIRTKDGVVSFEVSSDPEAVEDLVAEIDPLLNFTAVGGERFHVSYDDRQRARMKAKLLEQSIQIVNRRINETGTREPIIQRQGEDRILVQVPGLDDPEKLKELLGRTAKMTFHMVDIRVSDQDIAEHNIPPGTRVILGAEDESNKGFPPRRYAVKSRVMLSGDMLTDASATYEQGSPVVAFKFNSRGARKFAEITQKYVGQPFAVVLDGRVVTAPVIESPILAGSGIIRGTFTVETANDLALLLRAGALPAPLKVVEERTVGPSLGADSIAAGEKAALLAVGLIMVFMLVSYGRFGLYADFSLLMNMVLIMGALSLLQATLTLPGIAGIVLTFGMAVDANVLIFERIREEIRLGKSARAAIEQGFRSAFGTIMDANITTLIAAVLLFYFGTGTIKGFAVTLSIGILSSMFSAILLTRLLVYGWANRTRVKVVPI